MADIDPMEEGYRRRTRANTRDQASSVLARLHAFRQEAIHDGIIFAEEGEDALLLNAEAALRQIIGRLS